MGKYIIVDSDDENVFDAELGETTSFSTREEAEAALRKGERGPYEIIGVGPMTIKELESEPDLKEFSKLVDRLVDMQVQRDKETGAVGIEEANCTEFLPDLELASKLSESDQRRVVAMFSLINMLQEEIGMILMPDDGEN